MLFKFYNYFVIHLVFNATKIQGLNSVIKGSFK